MRVRAYLLLILHLHCYSCATSTHQLLPEIIDRIIGHGDLGDMKAWIKVSRGHQVMAESHIAEKFLWKCRDDRHEPDLSKIAESFPTQSSHDRTFLGKLLTDKVHYSYLTLNGDDLPTCSLPTTVPRPAILHCIDLLKSGEITALPFLIKRHGIYRDHRFNEVILFMSTFTHLDGISRRILQDNKDLVNREICRSIAQIRGKCDPLLDCIENLEWTDQVEFYDEKEKPVNYSLILESISKQNYPFYSLRSIIIHLVEISAEILEIFPFFNAILVLSRDDLMDAQKVLDLIKLVENYPQLVKILEIKLAEKYDAGDLQLSDFWYYFSLCKSWLEKPNFRNIVSMTLTSCASNATAHETFMCLFAMNEIGYLPALIRTGLRSMLDNNLVLLCEFPEFDPITLQIIQQNKSSIGIEAWHHIKMVRILADNEQILDDPRIWNMDSSKCLDFFQTDRWVEVLKGPASSFFLILIRYLAKHNAPEDTLLSLLNSNPLYKNPESSFTQYSILLNIYALAFAYPNIQTIIEARIQRCLQINLKEQRKNFFASLWLLAARMSRKKLPKESFDALANIIVKNFGLQKLNDCFTEIDSAASYSILSRIYDAKTLAPLADRLRIDDEEFSLFGKLSRMYTPLKECSKIFDRVFESKHTFYSVFKATCNVGVPDEYMRFLLEHPKFPLMINFLLSNDLGYEGFLMVLRLYKIEDKLKSAILRKLIQFKHSERKIRSFLEVAGACTFEDLPISTLLDEDISYSDSLIFMLILLNDSPCAKTKTMLFFAWVLASLAPAFALNPAYHPSNKCSQSEAVRMSIALVHRWSTLVNNGDPDFIIKNFLAEDALQYFVPDEEQCTYQPISLSVSLIQQFTEAIRMELIIKNVKWYEWQAGTRSNDSSDHSSGYYRKPRADVRDGDVVISAVGFISADGINPSLFNVLFYLRASCGCNYQVYRQVVTPYNCLSKIAGNVCES